MDVKAARRRLEAICDELDRSIGVLNGNGEHKQWAGEYPQDPADAGANLSETERSEAVLDAARRQRKDVLAALQRIDLGTYGTCVECGGPVPEGRLEAKPDAARCVACQGKLDRRRR
ncbi:MAG: TraR/DksA family transcriptional regulator [Actinobacteria bacterium]|nr:TraR/DksA family transcriptional regulator [Actinomycetota bacterium]MBO0835592.1 TraR/DksA family transcriptional regulator [Actinomycetota bacterium]